MSMMWRPMKTKNWSSVSHDLIFPEGLEALLRKISK